VARVTTEVVYKLEDGTVIGFDATTTEGPNDSAYHEEQARNWFIAAAAGAYGQAVGWAAGEAAGTLVLSVVSVQASTGTYAAALGIAAISPWIGMGIGAGLAAY